MTLKVSSWILLIIFCITIPSLFYLQRLSTKKKQNVDSNSDKPKRKWVTFPYTGKETTFVTKLFRQTNFKISYRMNTSIERTLKSKNKNFNKYLARFINYLLLIVVNLRRPYWEKSFKRHKEHHPSFRNNNYSSKFAHLLEKCHTFGHMESIMHVLYWNTKGTWLDTVERVHRGHKRQSTTYCLL
jgi:hypothetical protein